nr:hypothetical protein [Tanacetum cinerariifolium]
PLLENDSSNFDHHDDPSFPRPPPEPPDDEIEPNQGRLTSVVIDKIFDDSTNDPLLEAVDLFFASDNSIPRGIENIDYDLEGEIYFLEKLLRNDSIPLLENDSSNFDHHDDPSFPRPPPEPPD